MQSLPFRSGLLSASSLLLLLLCGLVPPTLSQGDKAEWRKATCLVVDNDCQVSNKTNLCEWWYPLCLLHPEQYTCPPGPLKLPTCCVADECGGLYEAKILVKYTAVDGANYSSTVYGAGKSGTISSKPQVDAFLNEYRNNTQHECWYQMQATYRAVLKTEWICSGHGSWDPTSKTCSCDRTRKGQYCDELVVDGGGGTPTITVRQYYVSIEETEWDYAPLGFDAIMNTSFDQSMKGSMHNPSMWAEPGINKIGRVYKKAVYREYTDITFKTPKRRTDDWKHLGILGPLIRAEVGDQIKITLRNNASRPYSMHPHGVLYTKAFEGAGYGQNVKGAGNRVDPGEVYTYIWEVPERAGPGPNDPSSVLWFYHSHIDEGEDVNAGLAGPIIITRKGKSRSSNDLKPRDVEREFIAFFGIFDENLSWYLKENIKKIHEIKVGNTTMMDGMKMKRENMDDMKEAEYLQLVNKLILDPMFKMSNMKYTINGHLYGSLQGINAVKYERVRWYVFALGTEQDLHAAHWHGATLLFQGQRIDSIEMMPGTAKVVDMVPDTPGTWLFHCHTSHHIHGGMVGMFNVTDCKDCIDPSKKGPTGTGTNNLLREDTGAQSGSKMWIIYTISSLCSITVFCGLVARWYLRRHNMSLRGLLQGKYKLLGSEKTLEMSWEEYEEEKECKEGKSNGKQDRADYDEPDLESEDNDYGASMDEDED